MKRQKISGIYAGAEGFSGAEITVCGWVRTIRDMKNFGFIELNDGSCHKSLQVVLDRASLANYDEIARQNVGAALIVTGELVLTPDAKQPFELKAHSVAVEGTSTPDYPLQKKRHSLEFLRTIQHLRPRTNLFSAVFRVRSVAAAADARVLPAAELRLRPHAHTHRLSDCEGAGEMFEVTTLDRGQPVPAPSRRRRRLQPGLLRQAGASLTVSGQLNAENFAMAFGDVYTFGPTFRAEKSNTQRHAAEFWMIEPEMAFADLTDYMDNAEAMIKYVINRVLERCPQEMEFFQQLRGQGPARAAEPRRKHRLRPRDLHRGRGAALERTTTSSTIRSPGAATCRPSTSATSPSRCSKSPFSSPTTRRR